MEEKVEIISKVKILLNGGYNIFSPLCGEIPFERIKICDNEEIIIKDLNPSEILLFDKYGNFKYSQTSEKISDSVLLFPSKNMTKWDHVFEVGEILHDVYFTRKGIFVGYTDNSKTLAKLRYVKFNSSIKTEWVDEMSYSTTSLHVVTGSHTRENFINSINDEYGITLNREVLLNPLVDSKRDERKILAFLEEIKKDEELKLNFLDYINNHNKYKAEYGG